MKKNKFQIAIDGPVAAGKGTVAKLLAEKLGFLYVDTGAMYRAAAYLSMKELGSVEDENNIYNLLSEAQIKVLQPSGTKKDGRLITIILNGEDVSWKIRTEEVSRNVPVVARMAKVREVLVSIQKKIADDNNVVMEGRDITHRVLPEADVKIYLTAEKKVRAERRRKQLQMKGEVTSYDQVLQDLVKRDEIDMNREIDPLMVVDDAWILDTTNLTIDEVVDKIIERFEKIKNS